MLNFLLIFNLISYIQSRCSQFNHCDECDSTKCTKCKSFFRLETEPSSPNYGQCVLCNDESCEICINNKTCTKCTIGTGLVLDQFNYDYVTRPCQSCQDQFCAECYDDYKVCEKCKQGSGFIQPGNNYCHLCESDGCLECYDDNSICNKCKDNYGFDTDINSENYNQCVQCIDDGCQNCQSDYTKCEKCYNNKGFDLDPNSETLGKCIQCKSEFCQECFNNANECEKVSDGFFIDNDQNSPTYGKYTRCGENCNLCDGPKCIGCINQYGIDKATNECVKCQDKNCEICSSDYSKCNSCKSPDFGLDTDENSETFQQCIKCPSYCSSCNPENVYYCNKCVYGFITVDGECAKCLPNCSDCSTLYTYCEECDAGFYKKFNDCIECPANCRRCREDYDHLIYCSDCEDGYILDNDRCKVNKVQNCLTYDDKICVSCVDGFGVDSNNNCVKCDDENCEICSRNYLICDDCKVYYYLYEGKCTNKCFDPNCELCPINLEACEYCKKGYGLNSNYHCSKCAISNCAFCDNGYLECDTCDFYYGFNENGECIPCKMQNCVICSRYEYCEACDDGYMLDDNFSCVPCEMSNCMYCYEDSDICEECLFHYTLINNECIECPENCYNCSALYPYCNECYDEYLVDLRAGSSNYGNCIKGEVENCKTYQGYPDICIMCNDGSSPIDNKCSEIESEDPSNSNDVEFDDVDDDNNTKKKKVSDKAIFSITAVLSVVVIVAISVAVYYLYIHKKMKVGFDIEETESFLIEVS